MDSVHLIRAYVNEASRYLAKMTVTYGSKNVQNGILLSKSETAHFPNISLVLMPGLLYTLAMVDPDAPCPDDPKFGPWLHYYVHDISSENKKGKEILSYSGPSPPRGTHHYVFLLFVQKSGPVKPTVDRPMNFPLTKFINNNDLELKELLYFKVKA
ncbi:hypothetical protein GJ496_000244 [Pomphorhynchus laevis]|nr:hypothetical protein GJ496_000244 [Pomphorhynchus laevis]